MTTALSASLQALAGPDVAVAVRRSGDPAPPLWPAELDGIARAVPARLAEFQAGRAAARAAMQALGLPACAIPAGHDRAPVWPAGVVGSISHSDGICAALVARAGPVTALGLDLEPDAALDPALWPEVCTAAELARLDHLPASQRGPAARLIFSAKECSYKALYPGSRRVIGFQAMQIMADPATGTYAATLLQSVGARPAGVTLPGRFARTGGLCAVVMVLR